MARANRIEAAIYVHKVFGIVTHRVFDADERILMEAEVKRGEFAKIKKHAEAYFAEQGVVVTERQGQQRFIEALFDGHKVKCRQYAGTNTVHIELINSNFPIGGGNYMFDAL